MPIPSSAPQVVTDIAEMIKPILMMCRASTPSDSVVAFVVKSPNKRSGIIQESVVPNTMRNTVSTRPVA